MKTVFQKFALWFDSLPNWVKSFTYYSLGILVSNAGVAITAHWDFKFLLSTVAGAILTEAIKRLKSWLKGLGIDIPVDTTK